MTTLCFDLSYNRKPIYALRQQSVELIYLVYVLCKFDIQLLPPRDISKGIKEYERKSAKAMLFAQSRHSAALAAFSVAASHCHARIADLCSRPAARTRAPRILV